jgi:WXG100 family type VII secretion target
MKITVETDDLLGISAAFDKASSEISQLHVMLSGKAAGPESQDVIGSAAAASQYARTLQGWTHNLDQLKASLETMARKLKAVADYYETTEQGNTVHSDSASGPSA